MDLPAFFHKKSVLLILGLVVLLLYAGVNVWIYQQGRNKATITTGKESGTSSKNSGIGGIFEKLIPKNSPSQTSSQQPTPTPFLPTPTPRPTGPGQYACDPLGICNDYGNEERKSCTTTFADRHCLDQCGDAAKRCTK